MTSPIPRRASPSHPLLRTLVFAGAAYAAQRLLRRDGAQDFRDQVALITGGSRGLGLVLARELGRRGARVAICARDSDEVERARIDLGTRAITADAFVCDVTDRDDVSRALAALIDRQGRIDVVINNAGEITVAPFAELTDDDFERALRTHFWGALHVIRAVLPGMLHRRSGRIVNIASIGGKISVPHLAAYSASKYALVGFSRSLRAELRRHGVRVTTVCPGLMRTGSHQRAGFKGKHRAEFAWFSLSGSLPVVSMSAETAARQIVDACHRGSAEVVLTLPAKIADTINALFPGLTADVLGVAHAFLPDPGGIGRERREGRDSESWVSPSLATALSDRAAEENNEQPR